jgi:hypothetical protein
MESGLRGSQWSGTASDNETSPNPLPPLTETHHTSPHLPHKMVADQENFHDLGDQYSETEEKIHLSDKYLFPYTGKIILCLYVLHYTGNVKPYCAYIRENCSHHPIVNLPTGYHNNKDYSAFNILTCVRLGL